MCTSLRNNVYVIRGVEQWQASSFRRTSAPGKKQPRTKWTLVGRVDEKTGEINPTDGRGRKKRAGKDAPKPGPVPATRTARLFYGATWLFNVIGEQLGISEDLKRCFPKTFRQILSVAYYLVLEDKNPL